MKYAVTLLVALLFSPAVASAASVRLLDTMVLEYRGDNDNGIDTDDDYGLALTKLYLDGQMEDTSLAVQLDAVYFTNYPDLPASGTGPSAYARDARLERIALNHSLGDASITLGDAHLQLGRGLVLALRKVDELGTDQALRGASANYQGDAFSARAFAGWTNIANLDGVTQQFLEDPNDLLAGASTTLHLGRTDVSFHGLYLQPRIPTLEQYDQDMTLVGGAYVDMPATDWLSLYAEGAVEQYRLATTEEQGSAAYAAADLDLQVVSLLLEGLYLDKFVVAGSEDEKLLRRNVYNQAPTLERIDQEVLNNEDVRGGRAKISRAFLDGSLIGYASGMLRRYGTEASLTDAYHGYGGFELTYGNGLSRWYASAGYREEVTQGKTLKTMVHGETDWVQSIGGGYALHLTVGHESRTLQDKPYVRGTTLVGFDRTGLGALMAEIGYDTFNDKTQQLFFAGIVAWEAADWFTMRAVLGSQRGGLKCIGGVCRDFPAFAGARFEATVHYDVM